MKKIIFSIAGIALFLAFSYFVFFVLSGAFSGPVSGFNDSSSLGGVDSGFGVLVRSFVGGLDGSDKLEDGASFCLGLGSKGDYVVRKVGDGFVVFSGVGECDVMVGVNSDYFVDLMASDNPCGVLRGYYEDSPRLAWVTKVNNLGNACSLGYIEAYEECFGLRAEEKEVIDAVCAGV